MGANLSETEPPGDEAAVSHSNGPVQNITEKRDLKLHSADDVRSIKSSRRAARVSGESDNENLLRV